MLRLKHREFIDVGTPIPKLDQKQHAAFLHHVQMSLLLCLEKKNLLTSAQREQCTEVLENQYHRIGKSGC